MLRRDFMPCAHNAALEQRESRFHGVSVHITVSVFLRVIDGLVKVFLHLVERPRIDSRFVGHNHFHVAPNVSVDNLADSCGLGILSMNKPKIAVTLADANNNLLLAPWPP